MILYRENPKDSTKNKNKNKNRKQNKTKQNKKPLLERINKFNLVTGYKINVQKCVAFLYTNSGSVESEVKKTILFFKLYYLFFVLNSISSLYILDTNLLSDV